MSVQVFLQGKLIGINEFVTAPAADGLPAGELLVRGRCYWAALLAEVLPRALLEQLNLARILLGFSGGGAFLIVLPQESLDAAEQFLGAASSSAASISGGSVRLVWGSTENLGDWSIVRKRLHDSLWPREHTDPPAQDAFRPHLESASAPSDSYFESVARRAKDARSAAWSPEAPAAIEFDEGKLSWPIAGPPEGVTLPRHVALVDDGSSAASTAVLASRSTGRESWGVLRGDVDGFAVRLRRCASVEEQIQLSVLFRQFFAGELELQCSMADFWRRVTILYAGDDDFAVYGSWDALLLLAREMQRLFSRFCEAHLKDLPGPEGKTIAMSLELAPELDTPLSLVYEAATRSLEAAKSADKDCFYVFGKTVEWRQLQHIHDLKEMMLRMVRDFGSPPQFLEELSSFYRDKPASGRPERSWRYHRRLGVVLGAHKDRELQRLRTALISDIVGKGAAQVKLRPAGRVAAEWARMLAGPAAGTE
jgi:CRISPR-associated protein Csm1